MRGEFLPELIESVSNDFLNYEGTQISLLETSHRNKFYTKLNNKCNQKIREFLKVPEEFTHLWMIGGVEFQYGAICMNLLDYSPSQVCTSK